jgi:hypothetical protein
MTAIPPNILPVSSCGFGRRHKANDCMEGTLPLPRDDRPEARMKGTISEVRQTRMKEVVSRKTEQRATRRSNLMSEARRERRASRDRGAFADVSVSEVDSTDFGLNSQMAAGKGDVDIYCARPEG